jgi:nicotinate phosphoribosyltransferase
LVYDDEIRSLEQVARFSPASDRVLNSATHEEIVSGLTTDVYFVRTFQILSRLGLAKTPTVAEVFTSKPGVLAGIDECLNLLRGRNVDAWALKEGEEFSEKEVILRIRGAYGDFGIYETAILGMLASASGWATAARQIVRAASPKAVVCFGARHLHPAVAPVMERAAIIGGASGAACILGAKLAGMEPVGTIPHALVLIVGDTVRVAEAYDSLMPAGAERTILVDTFKDEAEESLRVAHALGRHLQSVRLDTPGERGGVTPALVREVRARLDQAGFTWVRILVSGGVMPDRIPALSEAGADAFGVGSYISGARPIDMTMDLKEVDGRPIAKRGRIPGLTPNPRLVRVI